MYNHINQNLNCGFTLLETMIVLLLFATIAVISAHLFVVSLRAWGSGQLRTEIREDMSYAIEKISRELRETADGTLAQYNPGSGDIDHTIQYDDVAGSTYVLYLHNDQDTTLDSTYNESTYDLRKASMDTGDDPSNGEGVLILENLVSPDSVESASAFTVQSELITLDAVVQRNDESIRLRTTIKPRNL